MTDHDGSAENMTFPFGEGEPVDYADVVKREQQRRNERLMAAIERIRGGETDWESLARAKGGLGMGRNELPDLLQFVWTRLSQDQLVIAVGDAWSGCEYPEQTLPRREWLPMFRAAGYHDDDKRAEPPEAVTLWRGGVKTRMAWTADRGRAEWFRDRFDHLGKPGKLWSVTVGPDRLLAHYGERHRGEDEYVIDPVGINAKELS